MSGIVANGGDVTANPRPAEVWRQGFQAGYRGVALKECPYTVRDGIAVMNQWINAWKYGSLRRSVIQCAPTLRAADACEARWEDDGGLVACAQS